MRLSHEGIGFRSFIDWKVKGSFFITGGYEKNFRSAFDRIAQLEEHAAWQSSGLVGLTKVVRIKSKYFKKTKVQLLYDLLYQQQIPTTQPLIFRIGYNF